MILALRSVRSLTIEGDIVSRRHEVYVPTADNGVERKDIQTNAAIR